MSMRGTTKNLCLYLSSENPFFIRQGAFIFLFCLYTFATQAQTVILRGVVSDGREPLPGVVIRISQTNRGTVTDTNGRYTIVLPSATSHLSLTFSFIGKETKTILWKGEKEINVRLNDKSSQLDEVLIVARPNINEIDVRARTGSIAEVDIMRLKDKPAASLGLALQGNVPGLQIINRGELGQIPEVRIRGVSSLRRGDLANEPLYVLDGQVITSETFFSLNPEDIKDIKILKDAVATALYGTKAANGVLEITSTRGFNGERRISYHMKTGITFRGEQSAQMMNSREKLELERLLENPGAPGFLYSEKYIRRINPANPEVDKLIAKGAAVIDSLSQINTDWYKKLLRTNIYQQHTVSIRGGSDATSYYTSIGYTKQGGQLKGNDFQRISGRISLDQQLSPSAILGLSVNGAYSKTDTPNGSNYSVLELVYQLNPYETENSKELYSFPRRGYTDLFNQFSSTSMSKTLGVSVNLNYNITPELELAAVGGMDFLLKENLSITPPTAFEEVKAGNPINERGKLSQSKNSTTNTTLNVRVTYRKTLAKHNIVLGGNSDYYSTLNEQMSLSGRGLFGRATSAAAIDNSIDGINRVKVGGKKELTRTIGVGVLAGYTYGDIYDFFATYKLDASSVLPKNKRNNSAWALGAGLDLKQYPLLKRTGFLKALRLRMSYGYTASLQGVSPESTIATFQYSPTGYDYVRGLQLLALPNNHLRAEQNRIMDYGFRVSVAQTDIDVSFYRRTTRDALLEIPIASSTGFLTQWQNIGVMENKGVDITLSQQLFRTDNWLSRIRVNFSYNHNKVVSLYGAKRLYTDPQAVIPDYEVGKPVNMIYGLNSQGINPLTGEPTFVNRDGQEVNLYYNFKREDFVPLGYSVPPMSGSIYFHLSYKNLELNMDFYYTLGGKRAYNFTYVRKESNVFYNAVRGQVEDMWFKPGDENKRYPSPFIISAGYQNLAYPTTRTIGSTDMIRLNNLSLQYKLSQSALKSFGGWLQFATIGLQGSNLFMLKRFAESDPESGNIVAPLQPVITLSLNVTL